MYRITKPTRSFSYASTVADEIRKRRSGARTLNPETLLDIKFFENQYARVYFSLILYNELYTIANNN